MKKIIVKQNEENLVPIEVLAESIKAISDGVKKLRSGRLNEDALILLIQNATPTVKNGWKRINVSAKTIKAVLHGMESLEQEYLKPVDK